MTQSPRTPNDSTPPIPPQVRSLTVQEAEQERLRALLAGKPPSYEDKVMDPTRLPALADGDAAPHTETAGFSSFVSETRYGNASSNSDAGLALRSASELGQRIEYRRETLNYGDYSLQLDGRASSEAQDSGVGPLGYATRVTSERITLRNQAFPITTGLFADTTLGDITSDVTDALSRNYRLSLGYSAVRGASTRIYSDDFDVRAGMGERGLLTGGPYPGFERSTGSLAWLGYTQRLSAQTYAGFQLGQASGVADVDFGYGVPTQSRLEDVTSAAASFGYGYGLQNDGDVRSRVTLIQSRSTAGVDTRNAQGVFLEAGWMAGRYRHEFGVYSAGPNLRFGDYTLADDNRGAYWRVDHYASRLSWGASVDYEEQNPSREASRFAADRLAFSANAQWRIERDSVVGGNINASQTRYGNGNGSVFNSAGAGYRSANASAYYRTRFTGWGSSRFSATVRRNETLVANDVAATGEELQWEHDWITGRYENLRPEFTTSLGVAYDRSGGIRQRYPTAGLVLRYWMDSDWSLGGSLRYSSRSGSLSTSRGLAGTLNTERRLGGGWFFGASAALNQAVVRVSASSFIDPQIERSNEKSAYVYLRWETSGGTPYQSLGLREGGAAGGGRITGTVFFDTNRDGEQQPGEAGVPNVEVILDGRSRAMTDSAGRYEFPLAATGRHQIGLRLESVPLPWGAASGRGQSIEVPLRGEVTARIPVVRVGD